MTDVREPVSCTEQGASRRQLLMGAGALAGVGVFAKLGLMGDAAAAGFAPQPLPSTPGSIGFNAMHPAGGTYSTFTLGCPGRSGGLATTATQPADQDVFIGLEGAGGALTALPFYAAEDGDPAPIGLGAVGRDFRLTTDEWTSGELGFRILSPAGAIPEPGKASDEEMRDGLLPAVLAAITVDNTSGTAPRRAFFGIRLPSGGQISTRVLSTSRGKAPGLVIDAGDNRTISVCSRDTGVSASVGSDFPSAFAGSGGQAATGSVGLLRFEVPAGRKVTYRIAIAFWHEGIVAQGVDIDPVTYWYTKVFPDRDAVARHALDNWDRFAQAWAADNAEIDDASLSPDQRFLLVHGVRSYLYNTRVLAIGDRPMWMFLEGQYGGFSTCDLLVDVMLYDLRKNPWTVRNILDWYLERGSYTDTTNAVITEADVPPLSGFAPGATVHDPTPHPGGLAFVHDFGGMLGTAVAGLPLFVPSGTSGYEKPGLAGVASYMTAEELTNWTLSALAYIAQTGDAEWTKARLGTLEQCLTSLINRDHHDPAERDGIMSLESDRTGPNGREITTYDALDPSVGQARRSTYLATKQWAAYVCLANLFAANEKPDLAKQARTQARLIADTTVAAAKSVGYIPALLAADGQEANTAKAIPVIEGLVFPLYAGAPEALAFDGEYAAYMTAMRDHLDAILKPGVCLDKDGAWKLSSNSNINWLTTPLLHHHIARRILGRPWDAAGQRCDAVYVLWCLGSEFSGAASRGADYWCFVEQFEDGKAWNSLYYPRGALAALWLEENASTAQLTPKPPTRRPSGSR